MINRYIVSTDEAGQRLDKWLAAKLEGVSRKRIKGMIDGGRVLINRRRVVIAGWELEAKDSVEVRWPKVEGAVALGEDSTAGKRWIHIYYRDRDLIVVEKPAGVLSVWTGRENMEDDMVRRIRAYMRRCHGDRRGPFVLPLHRLDVETSGVMVFALSKAGGRLQKQFHNHSVRREYMAVVEGRIEKEHGIVDKPLKKGEFGMGMKVSANDGEGAHLALTEYRVRERYSGATLLDVRVKTGRTHQIRVHLATIGHPLIGENIYAAGKTKWRFPRHALHAHILGFHHPGSGKRLMFRSPVPEDMRALIDELRASG